MNDNAKSSSILSFSPQTFAALSPSLYLLAHLKPTSSKNPSLRPNQRSSTEFRTPNINTSSLTHANGSAVVRLGNTAVVCGVRGEILKAEDIPRPCNDPVKTLQRAGDNEDRDTTIQDVGLLVPNIELSTGCSPQHLPGNAPLALAQALTHRLRSLLYTSHLVRCSDLRIWSQPPATSSENRAMEIEGEEEEATPEVKAYWTLYIDILFIALDGGAFDAAWGAIIAALRDTTLPRAWWDADRETVLCSDQRDEAKILSLRGMPMSMGFGIFTPGKGGVRGNGIGKRRLLRGLGALETTNDEDDGAESWVVADMDTFEEELCREQVTVTLDCRDNGETKILRIEKIGGIQVGMKEMRHIVRLAESRWAEWRNCLEASKR